MFVEGLVIGCYALDCHLTYVYCRGEFRKAAAARLQQAIDEAYAQGYLGKNIFGSGFDLDMQVVIAPAPTSAARDGAARVARRAERISAAQASVPANAGGGLFKQRPRSTTSRRWRTSRDRREGRRLVRQRGRPQERRHAPVRVSGHVNVPGARGADGTTFRVLLDEYCGGMRGNKKLKAIIPAAARRP